MTTIYFNFPAITVSLQGVTISNQIQLPKVGQPVTNIQLNNVNYSAYSIIIAQSSSSSTNTTEPGHLIVKCYADINDTTSNLVYLAIPLKVVADNPNQPSSDVDNIINATDKTSTVNLDLNKYIKNGGSCHFSLKDSSVTITLDSTSAIPIKQPVGKSFYNGEIPNLEIDPNVSSNKNATLQQQDLDWIMSCELLTEDGPTEKQAIDPGTTATTISLFMMTILISIVVYSASPFIYKESGMYTIATTLLDDNHFSINVYWMSILTTLAIFCIVQGIQTNNIYLFIAVSLILSFFSATSAILKIDNVANSKGTAFAKHDSSFDVFSEIIFSWSCYSSTGKFLKAILIFLFGCSFFGLFFSTGFNNQFAFVLSMGGFLFFALAQLIAISYFNKTSNP